MSLMAFQSHSCSSFYGVDALRDLTALVSASSTSPKAAVGSDPQSRCWDTKDAPLCPLLRKEGTPRSPRRHSSLDVAYKFVLRASETSLPGRPAPPDRDIHRSYSGGRTEE